MGNNPLSSLSTPEQKKIYNKKMLYSYFFPFKQKKLNQVENCVKKKFNGFDINYPIFFDFKYPPEGSKYGIALINPMEYMEDKIFIHYNPRLIIIEFDQLVFIGLHEYCHIIYQQKELFSDEYFQQIFLNIDYYHFIESIDYLTNKFILENIFKILPQKREILKDLRVIEEHFAEGFAGYLFDSQMNISIEDKKHFETIINTHIQIMKRIRHLFFCE